MDHIDAMMQLRNGIGLRGYGQKDPLVEYRREAIEMFNNMTESISENVAIFLFRAKLQKESVKQMPHVNATTGRGLEHLKGPVRAPQARAPQGTYTHATNIREVKRNEPCPCKSGKKYKQCCGREE